MKRYRAICIDDDEQFLASLASVLPTKVAALCPNFECTFDFAASSQELFEMLADPSAEPPLAMVISDQIMPGISGIELIEKLKGDYPHIVTTLLTGYGGMDSAKYAINHALLDQYVSKPIEDIQEFAALTANLLKRHHSDQEERERTAQLAATVEELRLSNHQIRTMKTAAEGVAMLAKGLKSLDFEEVVDLVCHEVPKMFGARWGVVYFPLNANGIELVRREGCTIPLEELRSRPDMHAVVEERRAICKDGRFICEQCGRCPFNIVVPLCVTAEPLIAGESVADWNGYLCMCGVEEKPDDLKLQELIAYKSGLISELLSVSLTNARLYQKAKQDSEVDFLTGVCSRRVLEDRLQGEHDRAQRYRRPFCAIIVDVDDFKAVNDNHGHSVGDDVLRRLTEIVNAEIRATDTLARFGGDEFVILMPETKIEDATRAAERIRVSAEAGLTRHGHPITISCGVAQWSLSESHTSIDVLRRADTALYDAKRSGRNRVEVMASV